LKKLKLFLKYFLFEILALILKLVPKPECEDWIVIGSRGGDFIDNSKYLYLEMLNSKYKVYWACHNRFQVKHMEEQGYRNVINAYNLKNINVIRKAKLYVICFDMHDVNPYFYNSNSIILNLFHGVGIKKLGNLNEFSYLYNPQKPLDYVKKIIFRRKKIIPNHFVNPCIKLNDYFADCFNIPKKNILNSSYPRTYFLKKNYAINIKSEKKILWMPTLRCYSPEKIITDYFSLKKMLSESNISLDISFHPAQKGIHTNERIDIYESINHYSGVLTDISSVALDLHSIGYEVYVYFPDKLDFLEKERGLAYPLEILEKFKIGDLNALHQHIISGKTNMNNNYFSFEDEYKVLNLIESYFYESR
jgi:hypothetical protein